MLCRVSLPSGQRLRSGLGACGIKANFWVLIRDFQTKQELVPGSSEDETGTGSWEQRGKESVVYLRGDCVLRSFLFCGILDQVIMNMRNKNRRAVKIDMR